MRREQTESNPGVRPVARFRPYSVMQTSFKLMIKFRRINEMRKSGVPANISSSCWRVNPIR
jgi:hypothetical protein